MPYLPGIDVLGFSSLPLGLWLALIGITAAYVAVEGLKHWVYRRYEPAG